MSKSKTKKKGRVMWGFIYVVVFLACFSRLGGNENDR